MLETRLYASKLLGTAADYREVLMTYAAKLAEDNLVERADELVRELCGPVFWCVLVFETSSLLMAF